MQVVKLPLNGLVLLHNTLRAWLQRHPRTAHWLSILRLGLFQFGMGLSLAPLTGTLNRVLIDEMGIAAAAVGLLIAVHYFVSPVRAIIGYRSDVARSEGNWRTPYVVFGAMLTYGGLAIAPFSLILLSGNGAIPVWLAFVICLLIFLAYGVGANIVETIFLALVSDITPPGERGRVLSVLWVMLVMGTIVSSIIMGMLLETYTHERLIRVMQGSAVIFVILAGVALWGREKIDARGKLPTPDNARIRLTLQESVLRLWQQQSLRRLFIVLFLATTAFATHDVLLEPYGGQVLGMTVAATTRLTALWGVAMLVAIGGGGWLLWRGHAGLPVIVAGCVVGALGFLTIGLASDATLVQPFHVGVALIGLGRGLFIVASIALVMSLTDMGHAGLFIGLWGVMQAVAQGVGTIGGGLARDITVWQTGNITLGYTFTYGASLVILLASIALLFAFRLPQHLPASPTSPWDGLQDVPADQIAF